MPVDTTKSFRIHWTAFIISFGIGLLYVYLLQPPSKIVMKYPTPYNAGKTTYRDSVNTCFQFKANKVDCPKDHSKTTKQPIAAE